MFSKPWFFVTSRLCNAAKTGDLATVKVLANPENVNVKGWLGWAPLHNAAHGAHAAIVEFLLHDLQAEVDILDLEKHTPLMLATGLSDDSEDRVKVVKLLLAQGADVNAVDDGGYSALQLAVLNENKRVAEILLEAGANVNHQNADRFTALIAAATIGNAELAQLLLARGADPSMKDGRGLTAADHAKENNAPVDIGALSKAATTPLSEAKNADNTATESVEDAKVSLEDEIAREIDGERKGANE